MNIHGCDVSHYQPNYQPTSNDSFLLAKATESTSYVDPSVGRHAAVARKAGLVFGAYHFLWPGNPKGQAAYFVKHAPIQPGDLLFCDWELAGGHAASIADKNAFLAEVKRLKPRNKVGLYVNRSMWNASDKHAGEMLWIAEYASHPAISEHWHFHQYTSSPIDQNWGNFASKQALADWAGHSKPPPPPVPPTPPTPGFDMTTAVPVGPIDYRANQTFKAGAAAGLAIDAKGTASIVYGASLGVDLYGNIELINPGAADAKVDLYWTLADVPATGDPTYTNQRHVSAIVPANTTETYGLGTCFKGAIPAPSAAKRQWRLRLFVRSSADVTVTVIHVSGWRMP